MVVCDVDTVQNKNIRLLVCTFNAEYTSERINWFERERERETETEREREKI